MSRLQLQRNWIFHINYVLSTCKATKLSDSFPRNPLESWFGVVEVTGKSQFPMFLAQKKTSSHWIFYLLPLCQGTLKLMLLGTTSGHPTEVIPPQKVGRLQCSTPLGAKGSLKATVKAIFSPNPWCWLAANLPNTSGRWRFINISVVLWQCKMHVALQKVQLFDFNITEHCDKMRALCSKEG